MKHTTRENKQMYCRTGEVKPAAFRSDRFCQINGQWYFVTREKTREGPYLNRSEADIGAARYVASMQGSGSGSASRA